MVMACLSVIHYVVEHYLFIILKATCRWSEQRMNKGKERESVKELYCVIIML